MATTDLPVRLDAFEDTDIQGELTRLRPARPDEAEMLYAWATDPEVAPFWGGRDYYRDFEHFLSDWPSHYFDGSHPEKGRCFVIEAVDPDRDAAAIGAVFVNEIDVHNRNTEFDVLIGKSEYRGKGFGTDALRALVDCLFHTVGLHRVWVLTYEHNAPARRSYEKVGFVREGLLRESDLVEGRWVDVILYGLLKAEFVAGSR